MGENDVEILVGMNAAGVSAGTAQVQASLEQLVRQIEQASLQTARMSQGAGGFGGFLASMDEGIARAGTSMESFAGKVLGALNPLNLLHSSMFKLMEVMAGWRLMEGGFQEIGKFVEGIFQLPIAMEKAQGAWSYMFNEQRTPGQSMAAWRQQGITTAQDLADWTMKASISLPYTRQDLIAGMTSLGPAKFSAAGIENYMPVIADVAGAQNPNLTLQQASYSIMGAMMGYTRMLRYDLHIAPEELAQFGYDQGNPSTLMPAMVRWSQFQGTTNWVKDVKPGGPQDLSKLTYDQITAMVKAGQLQSVDVSNMDAKQLAALQKSGQMIDIGAAYQFSHGTFWGELSSFWDRIQNSELATGQYGPFQSLKQGLEWVNQFMDTHADQISKLAKLVGGDLSAAMQAGGKAFMAFAQGLAGTGVGANIDQMLQNLGKFLSDPKNIENFDRLATTVGKDLGDLAKHAGDAASGIESFLKAVGPGPLGLLDAFSKLLDGMQDQIGRLGHGLGDLVKAIQDVASGNWKQAGRDLVQFGVDMTLYATGGQMNLTGNAVGQSVVQAGLNALGLQTGQQFAYGVGQGIMQGITQSQFRQEGNQITQSIIQGMRAQRAALMAEMQEIAADLVRALGIGFSGTRYGATLRQAGKSAAFGSVGSIFG